METTTYKSCEGVTKYNFWDIYLRENHYCCRKCGTSTVLIKYLQYFHRWRTNHQLSYKLQLSSSCEKPRSESLRLSLLLHVKKYLTLKNFRNIDWRSGGLLRTVSVKIEVTSLIGSSTQNGKRNSKKYDEPGEAIVYVLHLFSLLNVMSLEVISKLFNKCYWSVWLR